MKLLQLSSLLFKKTLAIEPWSVEGILLEKAKNDAFSYLLS